jgi:hypothetical protein
MRAELATIWHNPCFNISVRVSRMNGFAVLAVRLKDIPGDSRECFNSTMRGYTMPAFTFEKISPPVDRVPVTPIANKKQRGVIVQILDRFAEARVKRTLKEGKGVVARSRHRPAE